MEWLSILGPLVALSLAALAGAIGYGALKASVASANALAKAADDRAASVGKDLSDYRVKAAGEFASQSNMRAFEDRILDALTRLGDRIDRALHSARSPD